MRDFCDGVPLWHYDALWNNSWPEFTDCFQNTVLIWVPCGWLWLTLPFYIWYLLSQRTEKLHLSFLFTSKLFLSGAIALLSLVNMVVALNHRVMDGQSSNFTADVMGSVVEALTLGLCCALTIVEKKKGLITSGVLFIFWMLVAAFDSVPVYTKIVLKKHHTDFMDFVIFYMKYAFVLIQLVLHCFAEKVTKDPSDKISCPETEASFLSRITFWWMNGLLMQGYRQPLKENNVFDLNPREESKYVVPRFESNWKAECNKNNPDWSPSMKYKALPKGETTVKAVRPTANRLGKKPSLLKVIIKTFGWELLQSQSWTFLRDSLLLISPIILRELIVFIANPAAENWKGYVYALGLFLSSIGQSLFLGQLYHQSITLGLRMRTSLIAAVFKKSLTMNNIARKEYTVGEIVNLMSTDATQIMMSMTFIFVIWSSPVQIIVALYLVYDTVGIPMFAGLILLAIVGITNTIVISKISRYQTEVMMQKDKRIKMTNEVLDGIKVLKLYAWETAFKDKIEAIRKTELYILWKISMMAAVQGIIWNVLPFCVALSTFITYVFLEDSHHLDAQTAFVCISFFNILKVAVNAAPIIFSDGVKAVVSLKRIDRFLRQDDLETNSVSHDESYDDAIVIKNGTFTWDPDTTPLLKSINLHVPNGSLVAVVGQVGAGKTSLICAMLGDMTQIEGFVNIQGKLAYVPQQAWIQNNTLQNNILFGKAMEKPRYENVLEACALTRDLEILPGSDMTEIGEKGINLSGGQKQRVSLARAVYSDADIYFLDDPLSAVDGHVGKHIFKEVVGRQGLLKDKTRILVTHGIHWLPEVDFIVVMTQGQISEMGSYEELIHHNGAFARFLLTYFIQKKEEKDEDASPKLQVMEKGILERLVSIQSESGISVEEDPIFGQVLDILQKESEADEEGEIEEGAVNSKPDDDIPAAETDKLIQEETIKEGEKLESQANEDGEIQHGAIESKPDDDIPAAETDKLIQEETVKEGKMKWSVYLSYAKAMGTWSSITLLLSYALYQAAAVGANMLLTKWTDNPDLNNQTLLPNSTERRNLNDFYMSIYGSWGFISAFSITLFSVLHGYRSVAASRSLHGGMLDRILRAPMSFFDTTPMGRMVNRFSQDVNIVDNSMRPTLAFWLNCVTNALGTFVVISFTTPYFIPAIVPLGVLYIFIQRYYITTSRQLQRMESKTRSPIFSHFSETISGANVIRAYGVTERFIEESAKRVDLNQQMLFANFTSARWLGIRLETLGAFIIFLASVLAVATRDSVTGGIVGLSITYALQITTILNWLIRMTSDLETQIVAVERIKEYTEISEEASFTKSDTKPGIHWPESGRVQFHGYSTRYRPGLDLVLKNITCNIEPGQRVGIVGRTGAGKSSLTVALFRLIEPVAGDIHIDGIQISHLGLHDLRSKLTILPQDPVLFAGSLRMNIDPFNKYTDEQIWRALEHAHIKSFVESVRGTIFYECGEGGENLSVGQRQLVCLARTLLRKTKVLILDEATAAVDMETDDLIQQTIRTEFKDCTILTIAHRLNTVMDYDKILVLDQGTVSAFDTPAALIQQTDGIFYQMAKDAGVTHTDNHSYNAGSRSLSEISS